LNGRITSWNKSARRLFGYEEQEILNKNIITLIPDDRLEEEDMIIASILRGERIVNFKTVRKTKDGREIDVALTVSPMYNQEGKIIGASKIVRDISAQVQMENKLLENNLELQRMNLYKDEFIGLLGHELKTPLTSLKACLQLSREFSDRTPEMITKAEHHVDRITAMLGELLDVAQIQSGRLDINPRPLDLCQIVKSAIEIVQRADPSHHINYESQVENALVSADELRMEQVIINLLTNAIKYSPGSNLVNVRVVRREKYVEVSVQDFGLGIPEDSLEKIWTRFYRVPAHKNKIKGLGIGLHLCRNLIHNHNGQIWAESKQGKGSVFFVRLPIIDPAA